MAQAASQGRKAAQGVTELGSLGTAASLAPGSLLLIVGLIPTPNIIIENNSRKHLSRLIRLSPWP